MEPATIPPVTILVDADACPVKEEIYRVAERHGAHVRVVSNQAFRVPVSERVKRVVVGDAFDAADDWIAEHAGPRTIVVTGDILLADRCVKAGARVLAHTGKPFDAASIGSAIATRAILADLRAGADGPLGGSGGGPAPFRKEGVGAAGGDGQRPPARSRFLQALDREPGAVGAGLTLNRKGYSLPVCQNLKQRLQIQTSQLLLREDLQNGTTV